LIPRVEATLGWN